MKSRRFLAVAAALAAAFLAAPGSADARVIVGFNFGFPVYWPAPYYYPAPVYYAPAPVYYTAPAAAPASLAPPQAATPPEQFYWHYCPSAKGYYPYVRDCPGGWQRVSPTPPQ